MPAERTGTLYSLAVGIDRYADPNVSALGFAGADARAVHELLSRNVAAGEGQHHLLLDEAATRTAIMKRIGEDLSRRVTANDTVIFYFAGHGSPETSGSLDTASRYLIGYDTDYENIYATGIDMERDFGGWFQRLSCRWILFFVDACFSGRAGGRTFEGPGLKRLRESWRSSIRWRDLDLGEARVVITACGDDEVASESAELGHGLFTHCLLETWTRPYGTVTTLGVSTLYDLVAEKVRETSRCAQTPAMNGHLVGARIPLLQPIE